MRKIKFSLVTKRARNGMIAIMVECTQFHRSIFIDTNVRIFKDEWNEMDAAVINNPNALELNRLIRKTIYDLEEYELDYKGDFTLAKLQELWECKESSHDFYAMMSHHIEHRNIRESTKSTHRNTLRHLAIFQAECSVADLTEDFIKRFQKYLTRIRLNDGTIRNHMRTLRCYYRIACKLYGNKVPCGSFDFYHERQADRMQYRMKALDEDDIRRIENRVVNPETPKKEAFRLEQFLFMSYTGMRISDFLSIKKDNFKTDNGVVWLSYTSIKTNTPVRIPLSIIFAGKAEQLLMKHMNDFEAFFTITDKPHYNIYINKYASNLGINKHVTAHVARHTCATRLMNKDVPATTIQQVVGHRSLKMTMLYAKINENTLIRQLGFG